MSEPPRLRVVPKPEGYDLRDKRSDRSGKACDWTPADALYDASVRIAEKDVTDLVAYWWERDPATGRKTLQFANATSNIAEHAYLLQQALHALLHN